MSARSTRQTPKRREAQGKGAAKRAKRWAEKVECRDLAKPFLALPVSKRVFVFVLALALIPGKRVLYVFRSVSVLVPGGGIPWNRSSKGQEAHREESFGERRRRRSGAQTGSGQAIPV